MQRVKTMQLGLFDEGGDQSPRRTCFIGGRRRDADWMDKINERANDLRRASAPPRQKQITQLTNECGRTLRPGEENQLFLPGCEI